MLDFIEFALQFFYNFTKKKKKKKVFRNFGLEKMDDTWTTLLRNKYLNNEAGNRAKMLFD